MNQRGDCTLLGILVILAMSSLLTLTSLSLVRSFRKLKQRTNLILCLKEIKGEESQLYHFIAKTNFAIKNISRAKKVAVLIPGLQTSAMNAEAIKKIIQQSQDLRLFSHLKKMAKLKAQNCPLPFNLGQSPYQLGPKGLIRNPEGITILRKQEWNYFFYIKPYAVEMKCRAHKYDSQAFKLKCQTSENVATLYFPSF